MERQVFSVSELNGLVKAVLDSVPELNHVFVRGEISNYKLYPSGHHYFTLKDGEGAVRCVMFKWQAQSLRFRPENGMKVIAAGRVSVFPRDGAYQLYCESLGPEGVGDLHVAFEQLKEKLWKEGLFAEDHKKPLPAYPRSVAIITSPAGAAVHDPPPVSSGGGEVAARPGAGRGGAAGNRGSAALRQPLPSGGRHHHRAGRRFHRGFVGLQRRAGGPGHL